MNGAKAFTDEEILLISYAMNLRDRCLFTLGIRTGFRISEILSLNVEDVYDGKNVLESVTVRKEHMKGKASKRIVPLHPEAVAAIKDYLEHEPPFHLASALFKTHGPNRMTLWAFHKALLKACSKAGISTKRISSHAMRKTFADRMNKELNGNIYALRVAMNHKSIATTAKYVEVDESIIWKAIKEQK